MFCATDCTRTLTYAVTQSEHVNGQAPMRLSEYFRQDQKKQTKVKTHQSCVGRAPALLFASVRAEER